MKQANGKEENSYTEEENIYYLYQQHAPKVEASSLTVTDSGDQICGGEGELLRIFSLLSFESTRDSTISSLITPTCFN
jgi:hypothetical protein